MGVYANIGGSSKQISSIYDNIDGTNNDEMKWYTGYYTKYIGKY